MIQITPDIILQDSDISFEFVRASGPGGQHVNKVATAVQLRFNTRGLQADVYTRLKQLAGKRMTAEGIVIIQAKQFKSQERNRQDAIERLIALLRKAAKKTKPRRKTRPTLAAKKRTLAAKQHRSRLKRTRGRVSINDD
jgi:ribosome-associated protein